MSSTGIDKILILSEDRKKIKSVEDTIIRGLKHPHRMIESSLDDKSMQTVRQGDYGLLIILSSLKDERSLRAFRFSVKHPTSSMILITDEDEKADDRLKEPFLELGVVIISSPVDKTMLTASLKAADSAHIRLCRLNRKREEEKLISRSKLILMRTLSLTEDEAHKYIEKEAMSSGLTKAEVAYEIIRTYDYQ